MQFKEAFEQVNNSDVFKKWSDEHKDAYLTHGFIMVNESVRVFNNWQIGYYLPQIDRVVPFNITDEGISIGEEAEAFKKTEGIPKLDLSKVDIDINDALQIAEDFRSKEYRNELPSKIIVLIQDIENFKEVWNITFVTLSLKTLNIKINSSTKKVVDHKLTSLMDFKAK